MLLSIEVLEFKLPLYNQALYDASISLVDPHSMSDHFEPFYLFPSFFLQSHWICHSFVGHLYYYVYRDEEAQFKEATIGREEKERRCHLEN